MGSDDTVEVELAVELDSGIAISLSGCKSGFAFGPDFLIFEVSLAVGSVDCIVDSTTIVLVGVLAELSLGGSVRISNAELVHIGGVEGSIVGNDELTVSLLDIEGDNRKEILGSGGAGNLHLNGEDTILEGLEDRNGVEILGSFSLGLDLLGVRLDHEGKTFGCAFLKVGEVSVGRIDMIFSEDDRADADGILTNQRLLILGILLVKGLRSILEGAQIHGLDTVDIGLRHEDEALELGGEVDDNLAVLRTLDTGENEFTVRPDSGDTGSGEVADVGLGLLTVGVDEIEETILTRLVVTAVLAGRALPAVLADGLVVGLGAILHPVTVFADRPDSTVGAIGTIGTVGAVLDREALAVTEGNDCTFGVRGNTGDDCAGINVTLESVDRLLQGRDFLIESINVVAVILCAGNSHSSEAEDYGSAEEQVFDTFVHKKQN